ncbi:MAG: hypothetical protein N2V75_03780 [Methanophagales archaeon]|nr:hypothetical protein [Methanophagales archaeon]
MEELENFFDWFFALIFGRRSVPISDDYDPQPGDRIATTVGIENTGTLPIDDTEILTELDNTSDKELEDQIYKETGVKAKIVDRNGKVVNGGYRWHYEYTYDIKETPGSPAILIIALVIVAFIAGAIFLWAVDTYVVKNMKIITAAGETINLFPVLAIGIVIFIILIALKEIMK